MKKLFLLVLAGVGMVWGQTPTPSPIPTITPATTFIAGGVSLLPTTVPHPTGWFAVVTEVSTSQQIYSISETDYTLVGHKFQTSARTGAAVFLRKIGTMSLYGLVDAGVATTGTNAGAAYAGGGVVVIPSGPIDVIIGVRELHTAVGGNTTLIEVGLGKRIK